jgi:hypothetical protein
MCFSNYIFPIFTKQLGFVDSWVVCVVFLKLNASLVPKWQYFLIWQIGTYFPNSLVCFWYKGIVYNDNIYDSIIKDIHIGSNALHIITCNNAISKLHIVTTSQSVYCVSSSIYCLLLLQKEDIKDIHMLTKALYIVDCTVVYTVLYDNNFRMHYWYSFLRNTVYFHLQIKASNFTL